VLTEGDDVHEPISDASRAILDGHVVLSRAVAEGGRYPAIDVEASVSRVATDITDAKWRARIGEVRQMMSAYSSHKDLIAIGAYQKGSDPRVDDALRRWPALMRFLSQDVNDAAGIASSRAALDELLAREV